MTRFAPDSAEPIVAWRAWKVIGKSLDIDAPEHYAHLMGYRLISYANWGGTNYWEAGEASVATCPRNEHQDVAPQEGCSCGIWGFRSVRHLIATPGAHPLQALGKVSLWGKVIVTERGYRAQFAYPRSLIIPGSDGGRIPRIVRELGIYGVPIEAKPIPEIMKMANLW